MKIWDEKQCDFICYGLMAQNLNIYNAIVVFMFALMCQMSVVLSSNINLHDKHINYC